MSAFVTKQGILCMSVLTDNEENYVKKSDKRGNELNYWKILNCLGPPGRRKVRYSKNVSSHTAYRVIKTAPSTDNNHRGQHKQQHNLVSIT